LRFHAPCCARQGTVAPLSVLIITSKGGSRDPGKDENEEDQGSIAPAF
jgi:hypothetical protein